MINFRSNPKVVMILLALIFFAPGLLALVFYSHPQWLSSQSTNKGQFVRPPVQVKELGYKEISAKTPVLRLVLWYPASCQVACLTQLDQLYRIRLALGRRFYQVQTVLMTRAGVTTLSVETMKRLDDQGTRVVLLAGAHQLSMLVSNPLIYIANPDGYLVLSYPLTSALGDVYHDLKQILTTSSQGN